MARPVTEQFKHGPAELVLKLEQLATLHRTDEQEYQIELTKVQFLSELAVEKVQRHLHQHLVALVEHGFEQIAQLQLVEAQLPLSLVNGSYSSVWVEAINRARAPLNSWKPSVQASIS